MSSFQASIGTFVGDSGSGGQAGLVPAPAAGDAAAQKYLSAGGGYSAPTGTAVPTDPFELYNLGLAFSVGSNILTIALKQSDGSTDPSSGGAAVKIAMRHPTSATGAYNERSLTAALSMTIGSHTTLNMLASQNNYLWIYAIDSDGSGTMKLAASVIRYDEGSLQSAVAESFTATVTIASPGVFTANGHGLNNGDVILLTTSGALPTGLSADTNYYVLSSAANTFQLTATPGGSAINTSGSQSGTHTVHIAGSRLVSNAVYSSKPIRLLGRATFNLSSSGLWASTPTETSLALVLLPAVVNMKYSNTGAQSMGSGSVTTLTGWTKVFDSHNAFNATTGIYVFPLSGKFLVQVAACFAFNATGGRGIFINVTGLDSGQYRILQLQAPAGDTAQLNGSVILTVNAGDSFVVRVVQSTGGSLALTASALENYVSLCQVG